MSQNAGTLGTLKWLVNGRLFHQSTYGGFLSHGGPPSYHPFIQWEFQDPKMEVPTIYKVLCKGISP